MKKQGGVALSGLLFWSIILVLVVSLVLQGISDLIKSANILTGRLQAAEVPHG